MIGLYTVYTYTVTQEVQMQTLLFIQTSFLSQNVNFGRLDGHVRRTQFANGPRTTTYSKSHAATTLQMMTTHRRKRRPNDMAPLIAPTTLVALAWVWLVSPYLLHL